MQKLYTIIFFFLVHGGSFHDIDKEMERGTYHIYGDSIGDQLGRCVKMNFNGSRLVIGAPFNDAGGIDAGQVKAYSYKQGKWIQLGEGINGVEKGELFGSAISVDSLGFRIAIGVPFSNANGTDSGQVKIYEWQNGSWGQLGNSIDGKIPGELFGTAISLSADGMRIAIGAPYNDKRGESSGQVRIYEFQNGAWVQLGKDISGNKGEQLGICISLNSDGYRLAIGAQFDSGKAIFAGKVKVVEWKNGAWLPMGSPIYGRGDHDLLGNSVSLSSSGLIMAIGSPHVNKDTKKDSGRVEVYAWKEGKWSTLGSDIYGVVGEPFGYSLDLSDDGHRLVIGTPLGHGISGNVQVYELLKGDWLSKRKLTDDASEGLFGNAISLSGNGNYLAIGAPFDNVKGLHSGKVKVISLE